MTRLATFDHPHFDHSHPINFDQLLTITNLHQHAKNQFIPFVHSSDRLNFRVPSYDWPHPFLTMPIPKIFNNLLTCTNLYQHAKNQLILEIQWILKSRDQIGSISYEEIVHLEIMQFDWLRVFWSTPQEQDFSQI